MMSYGIAVFDIDLKPAADAQPGEAINMIDLYGPYSSQSKAEEFRAYIEENTRQRYASRYEEGRYEFKLEIMPMLMTPVQSDGWL